MFRLALFSLPVAILPLLAVHLVETLVTRSLLPQVAVTMQQAVTGTAAPEPAALRPGPAQRVVVGRVVPPLPGEGAPKLRF